jgi:acetyltransferase-like isoleucine patch superfamily enzyme
MSYTFKKYYRSVYQKLRKLHYKILSSIKISNKSLIINQPALFLGNGEIVIGDYLILGFYPSPFFYNGYNHIEARTIDSKIIFGKNVFINNSSTIIADKATIKIEDNVLIGQNFTAISSDFHPINRLNRKSQNYIGKDIVIKKNVFIGANVTILKGVIIGENSVIGSSSLVNINIPANTIATGNPIKIVREINFE